MANTRRAIPKVWPISTRQKIPLDRAQNVALDCRECAEAEEWAIRTFLHDHIARHIVDEFRAL